MVLSISSRSLHFASQGTPGTRSSAGRSQRSHWDVEGAPCFRTHSHSPEDTKWTTVVWKPLTAVIGFQRKDHAVVETKGSRFVTRMARVMLASFLAVRCGRHAAWLVVSIQDAFHYIVCSGKHLGWRWQQACQRCSFKMCPFGSCTGMTCTRGFGGG